MADTARQIANLTSVNIITTAAWFVVDATVSGNVVTRKIQANNLFGSLPSNVAAPAISTNQLYANVVIVAQNNTPANSTVSATAKTIWWDDNYLYVVTSDGTIKRAAISTF